MAGFLGLGGTAGSVAGASVAAVVVAGGVYSVVVLRGANDEPPAPTPVVASETETPEQVVTVEPTVEVEPPAPKIIPPSFDVVHVDADGNAIMAGRAAPLSIVTVLIDGTEAHRAKVDNAGSFAAVFAIEPSDVPRMVSLSMELDDGSAVPSDETVILAPPETEAPIVVAEAETIEEPVVPAPVTEDLVELEIPAAPETETVTEDTEVATLEPSTSVETEGAEVAEATTEVAEIVQPSVTEELVAEVEPVTKPEASASETVTDLTLSTSDETPVVEDVIAETEPTQNTPVVQPESPPTETATLEVAPETELAKVEPTVEPNVSETTAETTKPVAEVVVASEEPAVPSAEDSTVEVTDTTTSDPVTPEVATVEPVTPETATVEPIEPETATVDPEPAQTVETEVVTAPLASEQPEVTEDVATVEPTQPEVSNITVGSAPSLGAPASETSTTAVTVNAEATAPAQTKPSAPSVLLADETGLKVLQPGGATRVATQSVIIDTISYDQAGDVALGGRGAGEGFVRVYLNNQPIKTTRIGVDGQWRTPLPEVDTGVYTLRVDELSPEGEVTSRMETPFKREEPEVLAALDTRSDEQQDDTGVMTVQPGHSLWKIARERYGEGELYVKLYRANRSRIRNPDLIYPGQVFTIPE